MVNQREYQKVEIAVLGVIEQGLVKIGNIVQQKDGSLYFAYKIKNPDGKEEAAAHHSRHADGTRAITITGAMENIPTIRLEKAKPIQEIEFEQELFQAIAVKDLDKRMEVTQQIKNKEGLLLVDLRGYDSFGLSLHYSAPDKLYHIQDALKFFKKATEVYIFTKTNPYTVLIVLKRKNKDTVLPIDDAERDEKFVTKL